MPEEIVKVEPTAMEMLAELARKTDDPTVAVEVAKSIVSLQQSMQRFQWESDDRQRRIDFDMARSRCQAAIGRIVPNQNRTDTRSWWADYAKLDSVLRPIYTAEGFSIGFSDVAPVNPGKVRVCGTLSRESIEKEFFAEITPSTTGPKGGAMANPTDADAIAMARAKRYILIDMFNVAVGIDKQEKEGIVLDDQMQGWLDTLEAATTKKDLNERWRWADDEAKKAGRKNERVVLLDKREEVFHRLAKEAK